jgi:hypothetical protein
MLPMERLLERQAQVCYSQMYFVARQESLFHPDMRRCFVGQENGLCGAATRGVLFLTTGLHTGHVNLTVELCDGEPALDDSWEEIVEASFVVDSPADPGLSEWGHAWTPVKLEPGTYRARYRAKNMQAARTKNTVLVHEAAIDSYCLTFWPAPIARDRVLKQTSEIAAYWHNCARKRS